MQLLGGDALSKQQLQHSISSDAIGAFEHFGNRVFVCREF